MAGVRLLLSYPTAAVDFVVLPAQGHLNIFYQKLLKKKGKYLNNVSLKYVLSIHIKYGTAFAPTYAKLYGKFI